MRTTHRAERSFAALVATLVVAGTALTAAPARADGYPADYGMAAPVIATGNRLTFTYYGWESSTYYGHTIWAMTTTDYAANKSMGCFSSELSPAGCSRQGVPIFTKPLGQAPFDPNTFGNRSFTLDNYFGPNAEVVLAIQVNQGDMNSWFFSGDPTRNSDGLAHLAAFGPGGVPIDPNYPYMVPGTVNFALFGFEDVHHDPSDWDFNNAIFSLVFETTSVPDEIPTPEPGTFLLLATGLAGLRAYGRRRPAA